MYKLIANPHYIKRENFNNVQNDVLFLKLKEKYRDLEQNDFKNILNLIDNYYQKKIIQSTIEDIINGCIFSNQTENENRIIERFPQ